MHLYKLLPLALIRVLAILLSLSGFTFGEVGSMRNSNSKVVCCHFSSDGKLLASAGNDKKVEHISFSFYKTLASSIIFLLVECKMEYFLYQLE